VSVARDGGLAFEGFDVAGGAFGTKDRHHSMRFTGFCVGWNRSPSRSEASPLLHCVNFLTETPSRFVHAISPSEYDGMELSLSQNSQRPPLGRMSAK
jgi:hypothetical protein